jgi:ribonuclease Z
MWEFNANKQFEEVNLDNIIGVKDGDEFRWGAKQNYNVRVFSCFHQITCVGYAFSEIRKKLKQEFKDKSGKELGALRKQGIEVSEDYHFNMFAYVGDTTTQVFEVHPWLFNYPVIITECTFLTLDEIERAEKTGHTHWHHLLPIILAHPEVTFILIHFSLRYSDVEVMDFFKNLATRDENPVDLHNVVIFVGAHAEGKM